MAPLLRLLARLLTIAWVTVLALAGLALLVYCLDGPRDSLGLGSGRPDRLLALAAVREGAGDRLDALAAPGPWAWLGLLGGLGAMGVGLVLLAGLLGGRHERLLILDDNEAGLLAVRRRAARRLLASMVGDARGVSRVRSVRVRPRRRGRGGRARVTVGRSRSADPAEVERRCIEAAAPLTQPLGLRTDITVVVAEHAGRVQ